MAEKGEWRTIQVIEVGRTPKGRPTVKGAGEQTGLLVGNDVQSLPQVGDTIEALTSSSSYDGKTFWWLNEWRLVSGGFTLPAAGPSGPLTATPDATLRFVSNVVGQAIAAKTIQKPEEILPWAKAAEIALNGLGHAKTE